MSTTKDSCSEDVNRDEIFRVSRYENKEPRQERWPCPRCGECHPRDARCPNSLRDARFEDSPRKQPWSNYSYRPYGQRWNSYPRNRGFSRNNWRNDRNDNKRAYELTAKEADKEIPMDIKMGHYDPYYDDPKRLFALRILKLGQKGKEKFMDELLINNIPIMFKLDRYENGVARL